MHRIKRALGALVVTALVGGLTVAASTPASAGPSVANLERGLLTDLELTGTGIVGQPLGILVNGVSKVVPVQWLRDGQPIPGATGGTYVPTVDDVDHSISALLTLPLIGAVATPAITILAAATDPEPPTTPGTPTDPGTPGDPGDPSDPVEAVLALTNTLGLSGSPEVGKLISVTSPLWSLPGVTTTYQWLRDSTEIPGADTQSYITRLEDAGHTISAKVTGTLLGISPVSKIVGALQIPMADKPSLIAVGDVSVAGTRKVGTALTASGPTWNQTDVTSSYQWLRDGSPLAGATKTTYMLGADDFGHAITVVATGHKDGYTDSTIASDPVQPLIGDPITFVSKPHVTGTPVVGKLLTVDPGQWTGGTEGAGEPAFGFQWLRDGAPIAGQVAQTYQVTREDIGTAITVAVTATRPAYKAGKFTTAALSVAKVASSVKAKVTPTKVAQGKKVTVRVAVKARSGVQPTGTVAIYDGRKKLKTVSVAKAAKGVRLAGLKPGVHKLRAVYAGSSAVAPAKSKVAKLTVTKPAKSKKRK